MLRLLAILIALIAVVPAAQAEDVLVLAAASLRDALDETAALARQRLGVEMRVSYGGTPALARQVLAGAPADLFVSASADWMDQLDAAGAIERATRVDIAGNELVLVAPAGLSDPVTIGADGRLTTLGGDGRVAMALVDAVPAGIYGRQALTALGLWATLEPRVVQADNARAALALVSRGEARFGIVYRSDALADRGVAVRWTFPQGLHDLIRYPAAVLTEAPSPEAARRVLALLAGPEGRAILARHGFPAPPR